MLWFRRWADGTLVFIRELLRRRLRRSVAMRPLGSTQRYPPVFTGGSDAVAAGEGDWTSRCVCMV